MSATSTFSSVTSIETPEETRKSLPSYYEIISSLSVPGGEIRPHGLVLVVGPNSSGKTQLLRDIHSVLTGQKRQLVVADKIKLSKPKDLKEFISCLVAEGYLKVERDPNGNEHVRQIAPFLGGGDFKNHNANIHQVRGWYTDWKDEPIFESIELQPFLDLVGHCLVTTLLLDKRIALANQVESFDYESSPPTKDVQSLYLNANAKSRLTEEIQAVFGKAVWVDSTRGNTLCIRVNQTPNVPTAEDRLEPEKMTTYRLIETEGDGLRSYVGICIALLLGRRPVCIVDEPELCLHPPQAYAMGQFIGSFGTSDSHSTFASTHSSHVLRGVIEVTQDVQILRLTRVGDKFQGHVIQRETIVDSLKRPLVRAETILDGIFADGVTIVESDGDRAVYQTAWELMQSQNRKRTEREADYLHRDILFIPAGGTGGMADIAKFYFALKIPVTIIADLDLILDEVKILKIVSVIAGKKPAESIASQCKALSEQIKQLPPTLTENEVGQSLRAFNERQLRWTENDDTKLIDDLRSLANRIDRMRRLKHGGIESFKEHSEIFQGLKTLVAECHSIGLFLVPVGELEYWAPGLELSASKQKKAEWANEAAIKLKEHPERATDLLSFIDLIGRFHILEVARILANGPVLSCAHHLA